MRKSVGQITPEADESSTGWPIVVLDEICSIASGITKGRKAPPEPLQEVPYMAVANVQDGRLNLEVIKTIEASISEIERYQLLPGDLLLTEGGDPDKLGRGTVWNGEVSECIHQNHIFRVRSDSSLINMSFLSRLVASPAGKAYFLSKAKQTTGIASINLTQLRNFPVPLPPLNEQRRIAAKLDATLAAVDACRQRLDGVEALLKRFRQAVLAAATSGELTREWREERGEDLDWLDVQLGEHAESMNYGTSAKSQSEGEVAVLRMGNLQGGALDWADLVYTSDLAEIAKYKLDDGDVLFNRTNSPELVGKTAIYRGERPAIYAGYLIRVRCHPSLDPELLNLSLNSPAARDYCWRVKSDGVSQSNINAKKLSAYPLLLPPVHEQQEIVRRTQELFSLADNLEARLTTTRKIVDRLTPALLAKAFRGELVPQDPNDEPASVLLERIRAARQAEAAAAGPSRRGRRKAAASPVSGPVAAAPVTPDLLTTLLRECGALSERALLAASELDPASFQTQLAHERSLGTIRMTHDDGQELLEAVG